MPSKRKIEDFDPNQSDPDDSDFDIKNSRPSRSKATPTKASRVRPNRKKRRTGYDGSDSDVIGDDDSDVSNESYPSGSDAAEDEEEPEIDERTGRPVRKSTRKKVAYEESDGDSVDFMNEINSEAEKEASKPKANVKQRRSLIVKLPYPAQKTRTRNSSGAGKRPTTSESLQAFGVRRSSRIAHDETDPLISLTGSGRHAQVSRPGTRSPSPAARRTSKGGKGLKKPPSDILEASYESSDKRRTRSKDELTTTYDEEAVDDEPAAKDEAAGAEDDDDQADAQQQTDVDMVPESKDGAEDDDEDEDDEEDVLAKPRTRRSVAAPNPGSGDEGGKPVEESVEDQNQGRMTRRAALQSLVQQTSGSQRGKKRGVDESSDFNPGGDEDAEGDGSSDEEPLEQQRRSSANDDSDSGGAKRRRTRASSRRAQTTEHESTEEADELAEELQELRQSSRPRRRGRHTAVLSDNDRPQTRKRKPVDYRIFRPELALPVDDDAPQTAVTPSRRGRGAGPAWQRSLFSTYGPFGGAGGPAPVLGGGPGGLAAAGGAQSDSSDDEEIARARNARGQIGGMVGMTPTAGAPPGLGFPAPAQTHNADPLQASLGRVKDKKELADLDPLGVDQNVNFDGVGGLQGHIDQLKEMVLLPLLYPEVFQRFKVTPPRGVLFHGPPGTGKTLLARALANSVTTEGRKVTFYMRKGADALSKWVGEAERQLRLLFEEARKNQPSIIFFDEIDGLAPVRSSKQEQIHASIVSTLLALMDGMDGRGQVIVIGATNRPDSVDPALRRPGRFDREFYFPLPNKEARLKIINIHTKEWDPPVAETLKEELADVTKGYGGADLRALCTEAAINAVQRRYPQIYRSEKKLLIQPETINVSAKDFMISVKKIVPSSERAAGAGSAPLPKSIEPLLRKQLVAIEKLLADVLPIKKPTTALEEAEFESFEGESGMRIERLQQEFERSRVFRPRLLIHGDSGMGQQYLASALLSRFEGLHVQNFDLPTLLSDSTRSAEAAVVQFFAEIKRHKPSVIYIPNIDVWYHTVGEQVISTFRSLLRSLPPTDPVLLLGVVENGLDAVDPSMLRDFFGYGKKNLHLIDRPEFAARESFFAPVKEYLDTSPSGFPDPADRKKRVLESLIEAPAPAPPKPPPPSKEEKKAQLKKDRHTLNLLKLRLQPIMDQIRMKYKKFRTGVIDDSQIRYLFEEQDPTIVTSDMPLDEQRRTGQAQFRPYETDVDEHGQPGLREVASGKFFYNLDAVTMEKRLSNGYYKRPKDFLADIKKLTKDAKTIEDADRLLKANELQSNVEVDIMTQFEVAEPHFVAECEAVYYRELEREKEALEKIAERAKAEGRQPPQVVSNLPPDTSQEQERGPITLGQPTNGATAPILGAPKSPHRESNQSTLTNGVISDLDKVHGENSNSTTNGEDVHMQNSDQTTSGGGANETQSSFAGESAQARPFHMYTGAPASLPQRVVSEGLEQHGAITPMAEGSNAQMYENLASSTSSEKRQTGSTGDTQRAPQDATQALSNGVTASEILEISMIMGEVPSHSQMPSTQGTDDPSPPSRRPAPQLTRAAEQPQVSPPSPQTASDSIQSQQQARSQAVPAGSTQGASQATHPPHSQTAPAVPKFFANILNDAPATPEADEGHALQLDAAHAAHLVRAVTDVTSALTIEQLEQMFSALMNSIWRTRGAWDRREAVQECQAAALDALHEMEEYQGLMPGALLRLQALFDEA